MAQYSLVDRIENDSVEMRDAYTEALIGVAESNEDVVALDADLMRALGIMPFAQRFPERTVDCGIMEACMYSAAAGLSLEGKIPFAHTFGVFSTRRAYDQIYISCAYSGLNVKVVGSDPGVTAAINGGTHMAFEDIGTMRSIPNMTVIEPTDAVMMKNIVRQISDIYGMHYIRLVRKSVPKIYSPDSDFTIGKANLLRKGRDVSVFASGILVAEALAAAEKLHGEGIEARVYDMFTIKPIDMAAVLEAAAETGAIVTAENHSILNGLGSAVAEALVEHTPVPMERVGVKDQFGEVGPREYLQTKFHLKSEDIYTACKNVVARKEDGKKT
jgi:transketolase